MKNIQHILTIKTVEAVKSLYDQSVSPGQISFNKTKPEFEGDITLLVFPLTKASKKSPEETANSIGTYLKEQVAEITAFNVVKGFLNLVIADSYWIEYLAVEPLTINHQPLTIDVRGRSEGIYFYRIFFNNGNILTGKIINQPQ